MNVGTHDYEEWPDDSFVQSTLIRPRVNGFPVIDRELFDVNLTLPYEDGRHTHGRVFTSDLGFHNMINVHCPFMWAYMLNSERYDIHDYVYISVLIIVIEYYTKCMAYMKSGKRSFDYAFFTVYDDVHHRETFHSKKIYEFAEKIIEKVIYIWFPNRYKGITKETIQRTIYELIDRCHQYAIHTDGLMRTLKRRGEPQRSVYVPDRSKMIGNGKYIELLDEIFPGPRKEALDIPIDFPGATFENYIRRARSVFEAYAY